MQSQQDPSGRAGKRKLIVSLVGPFPKPFGGVAVHTTRLRTCLQTDGHEVVSLSQGKARPSEAVEEHLGNSPLAHFLKVRAHARGLVHLHHAISPLTYASARAARSRGLPLLLSIHGYPFSAFTKRRGYDFLLRGALRLASGLVAVNEDIETELKAIAPGVPTWSLPAFLPPQPSEIALASPAFVSWNEETSTLGPLLSFASYRVFDASPAAGAHLDIYGIDLIASAVEALAQTSISRFRLVLMLSIGPRDQAERDYLDERVERIRRHLGEGFALFESEYAPPVIAASHAFLRPSYTDGDSVAVREAITLGVPVLASDAVVRPEECRIVPTGDVAAWAESIAEVVRTPSPPTRRAPVSENYSKLLKIYEAVSRG